MPKFTIFRDIVQTNKYEFVVEADNREEAIGKLDSYLEVQCPAPFQGSEDKSIMCVDREADV